MVGTSEDATMRMKKNVLRWFEYFDRMSDEGMTKKTKEKSPVRELGENFIFLIKIGIILL